MVVKHVRTLYTVYDGGATNFIWGVKDIPTVAHGLLNHYACLGMKSISYRAGKQV
jgi:hypothetical protein